MNHASSTLALAVMIFLAAAVSPCRAQDSTIKQLEAVGSYDTALKAGSAAVPASTGTGQELQTKADEYTHEYRMQQERNKVYEVLILSVLALGSLFLALRFLSAKSAYSGPHIVNATGLICIIFGTILLVIMAQSDQQLTAAVGILGAIAGYLFRSMRSGEEIKEEKEKT